MRRFIAIALLGMFVFGFTCAFASEHSDARTGAVRTVEIDGPYGNTFQPDSNRSVPIIVTPSTVYAETTFLYISGTSRARILIHPQVWHGSECTLRKVIRHEAAHAAGWGHYEGSPQLNPAYYPSVLAC